MELDKKERLILVNQLKILEKLYPDEASYYAQHRKALEEGYSLHYRWLIENIDDEMSNDDCREVLDILDMFRAITFANRELSDDEKLQEREIRFEGFDGNNETKQMSYTRFFIADLGRYKELRDEPEFDDFNSHGRRLDKYQRMLSVWQSLPDKHDLTKDEIVQILTA